MERQRPFHKISSKLLLKENPLPEDPTFTQRLWHKCLCPPHSTIAYLLTRGLVCLLAWLVAFALVRKEALPGGNIFALMALTIGALFGGFLMSLIRLPPLLGMLIVGFMMRNVPGIDIAADIDQKWSSVLRNVALTIILTRAGLGLDGRALLKLSKSVILLAFLPCSAEAATVGVAAYLILGFPWIWGFLLGFVQAAVSPAVVVPFMLKLQESKLGTNKGIPTLLMAASSLDDVLAISGFSVLISVIFSRSDFPLWMQLLQGPLEILMGLAYGCFIGVVFWYLPHLEHEDVSLFRFLFLFLGGLVGIIGLKAAGFAGAGALGCLTAAFVAGHRWRTPGWNTERVKAATVFAYLWTLFQPVLFGLIGAEVVLKKVQIETVGLGIAVLICGLIVRMAATILAVTKSGLNLKEKFFTAIAWIPKATVQAALGSLALVAARESVVHESNPEARNINIDLGEKVVTIAVLLIVITAPLGAIGITLTSNLLLQKEIIHTDVPEDEVTNNKIKVPIASDDDDEDVFPDLKMKSRPINGESIKMIDER